MIYDALRATKSHPTAEDLRRLVPGTSTATVYNTLEALCEAGLCRKMPMDGGAARYDADRRDHLHIVLEDGEIVDVPDELGRRLIESLRGDVLEEIESALGVEVRDLRLELRGSSCQRADS